jgi:uncharacterized repeat protein (TIGR01451 family)
MHIPRNAARGPLFLAAATLIGCGWPASEPDEANGAPAGAHVARQAVSSADVTRHHGPVMQFLTIRPIFWLPPEQHFESGSVDADYEAVMTQFIHDVDQTPYYDLIRQYNGEANPRLVLDRPYVDQTPYPHEITFDNPLRPADLEAEVARSVAAVGGAEDLNHLYVVFTAEGIAACSNAACSQKPCGFHSHFSDGSADAIYAWVGTWPAGCSSEHEADQSPPRTPPNGSWARDSSINILSHEMFEAISDPHLDAWKDDASGHEIGDLCEDAADVLAIPNQAVTGADVYLNGHPYHVQQEWSQQVHACAMDACLGGICAPSLRMSESVDDETPVAGGSDTYHIEVRNLSDTAVATQVVVSGTMPAGYTVTRISPSGGSFSGSSFSYAFSKPIAVHDVARVDVTVKVGSAVGRTDRACASATVRDQLGGPQPGVSSSPCATTTPTAANAVVRRAADWDRAFQAYGDHSGKWNGGDGAESTVLPDGGTAWFFNDSYYGNVEADGTRPLFGNSTPRNMVLVQRGTGMTNIAGPSNPYLNPLNLPGTLVIGPGKYSDAARYNLTGGDGVMIGSTLFKFYTVQDAQGGNTAFPDWPVDNALAEFAWNGSTLTLSSVELLGMPQNGVSWGVAVLDDGGFTYIYGVEDIASPMHKYLHIARVPQGQLASWGAWQYRTAGGWSSSYADSARIMDWVSDGFSVTNVNGTFVLLTTDSSPGGITWSAVAYYASSPDGFTGAGKHVIYVPPEAPGMIHYEYRIHPQFSSGSHVLIGYSTNTLNIDLACMGENNYDASIYRPRFLDVQLPGIAGPSGALAAAPDLGSPLSYREPRVPRDAETWHVIDPSAGSFSSTTCSMTSPLTPSAPSLTAVANPDDTITLRWTMSPTAMWIYNLQYHDDTADPSWNNPPASDPNCANAADNGGWCQSPYPLVAVNSMVMQYLDVFHLYSYRVEVGPWRANAGAWSDPVTAYAHVDRPTHPPTDLRATPGYGSIHLTWSDSNPNAWFKVRFQAPFSDVVETPDPGPDRSLTLYDLHAVDFTLWVVENNQAGDGPQSLPVTATPLACGGITNPPCELPDMHAGAARRAPAPVTP